MEGINFVTKLFWQHMRQILEMYFVFQILSSFSHHHDTVLSIRITVPSVPKISHPKGQEN